MYCPNCRYKVILIMEIEVVVDYGELLDIKCLSILPTTILSGASRSGLKETPKVFKCPSCSNTYSDKNIETLLVRSELSDKYISISDAIIVSEKAKEDEIIDNKVVLIKQPVIIHKDEIEAYRNIRGKRLEQNELLVEKISKINIEKLF